MKTRRQLSHFVSTFGILPAAGFSLLLFNTFSVLQAAEYTWTYGTAGTANLSDSTKWLNTTAVPVAGATDATVTFLAAQAASSTLTVTNDRAGTLVLNRLNFTNSNDSGTAPTFNLSGNALKFVTNVATAPYLSLNPTGTTSSSRPRIVISNNITLDNDLTLSQSNASVSATLSGVIDGAGGLQKTSGAGSVTISNTTNSFTGPVVISAAGSLSVPMIGNVSSNSPLGKNGSITLGGGGNSGQLTWTGNNETTDKVFTLGGSTGGGTIFASTSSQTLTITSALVSGTSISNRSLTLAGSGNIAFNGTISNGTGASGGVVSVVKSGTGTVTLGGGNGYTGGTTLSAGTLALGNNSALGTGSLAVTANSSISAVGSPTIANAISIASTFAATFNIGTGLILTDSGIISGAGALTKSGAGRLTLSGTASDFTGAVTISQGEIYATTLGSTTTAGSLGKGSVLNMGGTTIGGTLRLVGTSNETTDKTLNMSGTTGGATITVTGATYTFNQPLGITGVGAKTLTLSSSGAATGQGIIFNGLIADGTGSAISFRANGSGSANFTLGNAANSFSGGVTVDGNIIAKTYALQVASIGNSGDNSCLGTNGTINLGHNVADSINILRYTGTGETSDKVINLKGTEGDAGIDQSGTGVLKFSSDLTSSGIGIKTFILQGSSAGTGEMAGKIIDSSSAAPTSLSKDGSGTWTLSGVNTYTGGTNIVAGTLALAASGSIDSSSLVTIGAGATLDTSARSSFSLPAGKTYTFTLDSTDAGSAGRIKAADLDISNASIALASPLLNPPLDDASYVIATYTGTLTGTFGTAAPDGYSWNYGTGTNSQITLVVGGYGSWKGTNAGGQAASLDWDNDSVTNGIEYFMNASAGFTANPTLEVDNSITWTNGGNILSSAYGTQFVVQTSSDLVSWADVPVGELDTNSATTLKYTLTGANKRFVRLMVTPAE